MKTQNRFHPITLLIFFITIMLLTMFSPSVIITATSLICAVLCLFIIKKEKPLRSLFSYFALFLLITATNPLFSHKGSTPLFFINGNAFTLEALLFGANFSAMLISILIWSRVFISIFTSDKMLAIISKASPKIATVISVSLGFIPKLKRESSEVTATQTAIGAYSSKSLTDRLVSRIRSAGSLIQKSSENAIETSMAMEARGYSLKNKTSYSCYKFKAIDAFLSSFFVAVFSYFCIASVCLNLKTDFYPAFSGIDFSFFSTLSYILFFILAMFLIICEIKEAILWKFLKRKI